MNYIQYNYTHDNPSGAYFECALGTRYTTYIRYNISQNDGYGTNSYGGGAIVTLGGYSSDPQNKMFVYNNDFYLGEGYDSYITNNWDGISVNPDNFKFMNNVIYSNAASKGWHNNLMGTVENNAYGGTDNNVVRHDDNKAVFVTSADFQGIGTGGLGIGNISGYKLRENSRCKNAGIIISNNGGRDYWGNKVSLVDSPNIGCDNNGAGISQLSDIINFKDRPSEVTELVGEYKNCIFGEGWETKEQSGNKICSLMADTNKGMIKLPTGKTLRSFTVSCKNIANVTVSSNGVSKSFCISSANNRFDTGFSSALDEVSISVQAIHGSDSVYFDEFILEDAEYERINLALGKEVETSGEDQYAGEFGNDGNEETMWIHNGEDLNEYWIVDLGSNYDLADFELIFEKEETEGAWRYQIEGKNSINESFDTLPIYDASDNVDGDKIQKGVFEPGSIYRYLRVRITGFPGVDYWPAFAEFKVYERDYSTLDKSALSNKIAEAKYIKRGNYSESSFQSLQNAIIIAKQSFMEVENREQIEEAIQLLQEAIDNLISQTLSDNLAFQKPVTTSADEWQSGSYGNDEDIETLWIVNGNSVDVLFPQWWTVDLGYIYKLRKYEIFFEKDNLPSAWKYSVAVSTDNSTFIEIDKKSNLSDGIRHEEKTFDEAVFGRYVRVTLDEAPIFEGADYWPAFAEFKIYADVE